MLEAVETIVCYTGFRLHILQQNGRFVVGFEFRCNLVHMVKVTFPRLSLAENAIKANFKRIHGASNRADLVRDQVTFQAHGCFIFTGDSMNTNCFRSDNLTLTHFLVDNLPQLLLRP